jgi:hypothetical protein
MRRISFSIARVVALTVLAIGPAVAETPQDTCDRLVSETVLMEQVDAATAVSACAAAVKAAPGTPRLEYEYGRALEKSGSIDQAKGPLWQGISGRDRSGRKRPQARSTDCGRRAARSFLGAAPGCERMGGSRSRCGSGAQTDASNHICAGSNPGRLEVSRYTQTHSRDLVRGKTVRNQIA